MLCSASSACFSWRGVALALRAIPANVRRDAAERGLAAVMSSVEAALSRCLISSHCRSRMRTSTQEPRSLVPRRVNLRSPLASAAPTSSTSGCPRCRDPKSSPYLRRTRLRGSRLRTGCIDRVVFGLHGKAFVRRIERWTFGNSPGKHDAVVLQTEIIMQPACAVLLNDKLQR